MARVGLFLRVLVKDGERALLLRDGRCVRVLEPGLHRLFDPLGALKAESFSVVRAEFPGERYAVQASSDLVNWTTLSTHTVDFYGMLDFIDGDMARDPMRFYRAVKQ